jgi:non-specific serine/threonine protein kinase
MNSTNLPDQIPSGQELRAVVQPSGLPGLEWGAPTLEPDRTSLVQQQAIWQRYRSASRDWLFGLGLEDPATELPPSLHFFQRLAARFIRQLSLTPDLEELRGAVQVPLAEAEVAEFLEALPPMDGSEYLDGAALAALWAVLHDSFARLLSGFSGPVADFLHSFRPDLHLAGRIYFHLVENKSGEAPFAFLATYSTRLSETGQSKHLPLKFALQEYQDDQGKLLQLLVTVQQAAGKSTLLAGLLESGELFHPLAWSAGEAYAFLREIPLYEDSGILCRIPNWWQGKGAGVSLKISIGAKQPAQLGMAALLDFRPTLQLGGEELTLEEARRLLAESEGLAFLKNKWVAVDPDRLAEALAAYDRAQKLADRQGLTMLEAMRLLLNPQKVLGSGAAGAELVGISHGQWLGEVLGRLRRPEELAVVKPDRRFSARLRPYQAAGLNWLHSLDQLGFGGCLADDMGLGKTIQVLAFLNVLTATARKNKVRLPPSLLVLPASLIGNWLSEIERFFPALAHGVAHPQVQPELRLTGDETARLAGLDLVITTYALVQRYEWLRQSEWHYVILDEAQAIKNPGAKQTRAVKALSAAHRLILTGTPVENHLSDLWSLFDFVNPGLLGTAQEFGGYAKKLAGATDGGGYGKLRGLIRPFILRRMKSDKSIIGDLPDKVEMKAWAELSRKQVVVYRELVARLAESLEAAEGIQRKGLVLAALLKFKQLCNHPDHYAGLDGYAEAESGKFTRLREICETIHDKRERLLVFSQFKEMTAPLARFLESIFGRPGLVLHGGVPVAKRKGIVEQFQGADYTPFLVLTVKAGGVGLNLTEANHVIHFDRWWNPAVENQATDRAFRIGQTRKVMVHKFLTRGTIEEKIDAMLERKTRLADQVIGQGGGENWLTELDNKELLRMVQLEL